jgi:hypothetical protein
MGRVFLRSCAFTGFRKPENDLQTCCDVVGQVNRLGRTFRDQAYPPYRCIGVSTISS